jgi:hypothetical protein
MMDPDWRGIIGGKMMLEKRKIKDRFVLGPNG